jgi:hypothetical protein
VRVAWREGTLTRAAELEMLGEWMKSSKVTTWSNADEQLLIAIERHLAAARDAALRAELHPSRRIRCFRNGSLLERATSNLDAAEAHLLGLAPPEYLRGQIPCLLRHVQCHLSPCDARRLEFERIAARLGVKDPDHPLLTRIDPPSDLPAEEAEKAEVAAARAADRAVERERRAIVTIVRGASSAALREQVRLRSFRNVVVTSGIFLSFLAVAVVVVAFVQPTLMPLCFAPEEAGVAVVVCPTEQSAPFVPLDGPPQTGIESKDIDEVVLNTARGPDVAVVALVGLTAAAVAAAAAIRRIKGSSERYGLPVALVALKLPTGAITAVLGLLLMRGQFVPGLSALDTSAQILAWALVFGYAQELFTRLVDVQGQTVLDNVRGGATPPSGGPGSA